MQKTKTKKNRREIKKHWVVREGVTFLCSFDKDGENKTKWERERDRERERERETDREREKGEFEVAVACCIFGSAFWCFALQRLVKFFMKFFSSFCKTYTQKWPKIKQKWCTAVGL